MAKKEIIITLLSFVGYNLYRNKMLVSDLSVWYKQIDPLMLSKYIKPKVGNW